MFFSYEKFKVRVQSSSEYEMTFVSDTYRVVRSKKHANAMPKHCYKDNVSGYFCCNTCSACIAYEEQCEHLIVANDYKFIKSHFDPRHLKRSSCQGSCNEEINEDTNMFDLVDKNNDQEENDDDFDTTEDHMPGEDTSSVYENDDIAQSSISSQTKPLTFDELKDLHDKILSNYDKCSDATKFSIGSLTVSIMMHVNLTVRAVQYLRMMMLL